MGKYLSGSGLGYLWTKIKSTFLLLLEESKNPAIINRKFATLSELGPHLCGNSVSGMPTSRKLIPLQVSPDFDGTAGCYVYISYAASGSLYHRSVYQISGGKLYTIPASGSPSLVTSINNVDNGLTNTNGFYVLRDTVYGNWWISDTNATIDNESFGIPAAATDPEPSIPTIPSHAEIYITGTSLDSNSLNSSASDFWTASSADVWVRYNTQCVFEFYNFNSPVSSNGGTRVCENVPGDNVMWDYTLTRTNLSTITITKARH